MEQLLYYQTSIFCVIEEVWIQTCNATSFRYILCVLNTCNPKTIVTCSIQMFYILNDSSTVLQWSILSVRARHEIQMASYGSKHALQSVSDKTSVGTYTKLENFTSYKDIQHMNDCYIIRDILCVVYSYMRDLTGELRPQTCTGYSLIQHCMCILQAHRFITIWCTTMHDNKTHILCDCILYQRTTLLPKMHHL